MTTPPSDDTNQKHPKPVNMGKNDENDIADLSDMKSNESDAVFPTFLPEMKLPQFSMMSATDAQSIENDFRNSVTRYAFDRKCMRSPSPSSPNLFFNSSDLLTNRIGQFYPRPVPHVFQHHHHHHISKHFHHMLNHHSFLQTNPIPVAAERSPSRPSNSTTLNLSTSYHQAHLNLHPNPSRQN